MGEYLSHHFLPRQRWVLMAECDSGQTIVIAAPLPHKRNLTLDMDEVDNCDCHIEWNMKINKHFVLTFGL